MVKYKTTCPNCQMAHSVEITDRQRHEEDFDRSLEYARNLPEAVHPDARKEIAIAMYEQKCLDFRMNKINENQVKLETLRQENKRKNMRTMRGQ